MTQRMTLDIAEREAAGMDGPEPERKAKLASFLFFSNLAGRLGIKKWVVASWSLSTRIESPGRIELPRLCK
jgi:hypothetical protein